jgi:hypothetical protein
MDGPPVPVVRCWLVARAIIIRSSAADWSRVLIWCFPVCVAGRDVGAALGRPRRPQLPGVAHGQRRPRARPPHRHMPPRRLQVGWEYADGRDYGMKGDCTSE